MPPIDPVAAPEPDPALAADATAASAGLIDSDSLVEEISIDGMCGVY